MPSRGPLVLVTLFLVVAAGCAAPIDSADAGVDAADLPAPTAGGADAGAGRATSAAGAPLRIVLELADARAFFGPGASATIEIASDAPAQLRAGLTLPQGVERVSGTTSYEGAIAAGGTVRLASVLRASPGSERTLRAWAEIDADLGSRVAPSALLTVAGDASSARFVAAPAPAPLFRIAFDAASDAPTRVIATIDPDVDAAATLAFLIPATFEHSDPHRENLTLARGETFTRTIELGALAPFEGGYAMVTALLYPDAALDGRLYRDALYYWWADGELVVSATAPDAPGATNVTGDPAQGEGNATGGASSPAEP